MPRIAVKHPSGVHLIYSTVVDDFLGGSFSTERLADAYRMMDARDVPICSPSFLDPEIRDSPDQWEKYWSTSVMINGARKTAARIKEILDRPVDEGLK